MLSDNILYAIITTAALYLLVKALLKPLQKRSINAKVSAYSKTKLSPASKEILDSSNNKKGFITKKALKALEKNIRKENDERFIRYFREKKRAAQEKVKRQKYPTCFDHLK